MRWKLIFLCAAIALMIPAFFSVDIIDDKRKEPITVEIRGEVEREGVYQLERGSSLSDLLELCILNEEADISMFSLQSRLYHKEVIVIPKKKKKPLISINSAEIEELVLLPGIGEKTAEKIIEYRIQYGSFLKLEDIMNVNGIGKAKYEKIKEYISL